MIKCTFENGSQTSLRHVVTHAIMENNGKLLLVRRSPTSDLEAGKLALPGGFLDRDEYASAGALRELTEETGWQGEIISLFKINTKPDRPHEDRQNVALEYLIKPIKKVTEHDHEISEVEWVDLDKLPPLDELAFDHGESIAQYLEYRKSKFPLPIII